MLAGAPSVDDVLPEFVAFIGADVVIGHNVNFDVNFLYEACGYVLGKPFRNDFIDTMRLSRLLFRSLANHRLPTLAQAFCVCEEVAHRAMADALVAQRCYQYMCAHLENNRMDLAAMVKNPIRRMR